MSKTNMPNELFRMDFCKVIKFDCKCGRRYVNTSNCRQCTHIRDKQTNADKIRSMDDEELAKLFCSICEDDDELSITIANSHRLYDAYDIKEWLESEVEE